VAAKEGQTLVVEARAEPIFNPVSKTPHRRLTLNGPAR
jgi:hypothetical protein